MKRAFVTLFILLAATAAAVATPNIDRIKAANIVPASQWVDTTKVTAPKFVGHRIIEGVGKVALFKDDCGVFYRLRTSAKVELKKYVRPDVLVIKGGK